MVPSGAGLVPAPPPGPAQVKGEAGAGDEPGGVLAGEADQAGGLGDGEPDGADAGRAGQPGPGGDGRVAERDAQVSVVGLVPVVAPAVILPGAVFGSVVAAGGWRGRESDVAAERVADGDIAELGEGGQGGVPADRVPGAHLGLVAAECVLSGLERFLSRPPLIPIKKKSSLAFRVHPGRY